MKIVIIRSNPVLPDPRVEKEAITLIQNGYEVKILAWNRMINGQRLNSNGKISIRDINIDIKWFNIKASFGAGIRNTLPLLCFQVRVLFWLVFNIDNFDVVHACDFDTVLPAWICKKLFRKKYVYDIFDYYIDAYGVPSKMKNFIEKIDTKMINEADAVIITNESRLQQIKSIPDNLYIIHNSPDIILRELDTDYVLMNDTAKVKFAYFGVLGSNRLLEEILEIFVKNEDWELHIGGFGPLDNVVNEYSSNHSNIIYYGKIQYDEVLNLQSTCDIMFATYNPSIPNHKYSSPNKLYEAMMLGKPIIVCNGTGIDTLVNKEKIGKSIAYSKIAFENACIELISEKKIWPVIKKITNNLYHTKFSWSIMKNRLLKLYSEL